LFFAVQAQEGSEKKDQFSARRGVIGLRGTDNLVDHKASSSEDRISCLRCQQKIQKIE
jgi:hypothetical protein